MDRLIIKYNKYDAMDFAEYAIKVSSEWNVVVSNNSHLYYMLSRKWTSEIYPELNYKRDKISMKENIFTEEDLVNWLLFTEEELVDFATYVLDYGNKQDGQVYHATYMNWLSERKPEIYKRTTRDQKINTILQ